MQKPKPIKGRGAASNAASRFVEFTHEAIDDGMQQKYDLFYTAQDMAEELDKMSVMYG